MELPTSIIFGKFPSCCFTSLIAVGTPDDGFFFQSFHVSDTPIQALPGKRRELDLSHIEPTPFDWGIVQRELLSPLKRLLWGKSVGKRTRSMGVQVVLDELNPIDGRVIRGDQCLHKCRIVQGCALLADLDKAPASQRLEGEQNATGALALLFVVVTFGPARFHWYRHQHIAQELTRACSKTDDGTSTIIRLFVQLQDIFHMPNVVASHVPDAPAFDSPWCQFVFF